MTEPDDPGPSSTTVLIADEQPIRISHDALTHALERGCRHLGAPSESTLSVTLVDEPAMAARKREAFGIEAATDVLSYPIDGFAGDADVPSLIGDLVLCPSVALRQAAALGATADHEIVELLAHGLLHLAGLDHDDPDAEVAMARAQDELAIAMRAGVR